MFDISSCTFIQNHQHLSKFASTVDFCLHSAVTIETCALQKEPVIGRSLRQLLFEGVSNNSISSSIIFVYLLLLEDYGHGAVRKELIIAPLKEQFETAALRKSCR